MTRLELAAQRAKKLEDQQKENKTSSRLELAEQRTQELYKQMGKTNNYLTRQEKTANLPSYQEHLKVLYNNDYTRVLSDEEKKNTDLFDNSVYSKGNPKTQSILKLQNFAKQNGLELVNSSDSDANLRNLYEQSRKLDKDKQEELLKYLRTYYTVENEQLNNENYIGNRIMKGVINSVSGGIDAANGLISKGVANSNKLINTVLGNNEKQEDETKIAKDLLKYNILGTTAEQMAIKQAKMEQVQNMGAVESFVGDVAEGISGMVPTILISVYTQNPDLALTMMSTSAGGNAYRQAINEGANNNNALAYGTLMAIKEYTTEKMFGAANKLAGFDVKGYGDELAESIINRIFKENGNKILRGFTEFILGGVEEGLEEFFGDLVEPYIKNLTLGTKEKANLKEALYNGLVGGITGLAMSTPGTAIKLATDSKQTTEKASMYPEVQKAIDTQLVDETKRRNIEYLKNKYGLNVNQDGTISNQPTNVIDRLKQKYNLQNEEYNIEDTNLKTTPPNNTNLEETGPNTVQLEQNTVQNAQNLEKTVQNNSTIQGLEDYTEQDIKDLVSDYIQDLNTNVQIKGIAINGSRARGDSQVTSDLDVVVEYDGDMSEDALFNILNEEPLTIDGIQVDINPITASKSGTLEQYMQKSKEYDNSKNVDIMENREYNSYRTVERKEDYKEGEIHASFTLQPSEFEQVRSEVSQNRRNDQDGLHYIDLSKNGYFSYIYKKQGDSITPIVQLRGHEDVLNFVRRRIENGNYKEYGTARRWSSVIRNEYRNYNGDISDMQYERQTDKNDVDNGRQNRQESKDNRRRTDNRSEENSTTIENSEEQGSFSMPETDNQGRELTKEQQTYFRDSKIRDALGRLLRVYHGSNSEFTIFDILKGGRSNSNASIGFWFTEDKEGATRFAEQAYYGDKKQKTYEVYINIKNPKVFESFDNSKLLDEITNRLSEIRKRKDDIHWQDSYLFSRYPINKYTDRDRIDSIIKDAYSNVEKQNKSKELIKEYVELDKDEYSLNLKYENERYTDSYEQFRTEIYKLAGKDAEFANSGNVGRYIENKAELVKQYREKLIAEGYDGIIIKDTKYDNGIFETNHKTNIQYVAFFPNQIKNIDNTNPTDNPDILKEPRAEYEAQMKLNMDVTTETIESAKNYNGGLKPIVIGHRIWEGYKKQGYIDLNNTKVSTAQDMAEIAQIFRNPYYETFRVIYTKGKGRNKVIVGQEALSSFLPSSVNIVNKDNTLMKMTYQMKDRMQRLSADGYYLIHNHPSGEATASQNDIRLTEKIAQKVPGFHEHIIVDHGTYAYIYMTLPGLSTGGKAVAVDNLDVDSSNSAYNQEDFTSDMVNGGMYINTRGVLVELASKIRHDENYSSLILTDVKHKLNAIIDVPNVMLNMRPEQIEGYIKNTAKKYGANEAFIATQDDTVFKKLKKTLTNIRDIVLYDKTTGVRAGEQGESVFYKEETSSKRTSMRVSEETKEERIERVRKYVEETQKSIGTLGANISRKDIVTRIIDNYGITTKGNSKELNRVSKEIQELIKKGGFTDNKLKGYAEQLIENLKVTIDDYYKANKELKELIRRTKLYASDSVKAGFVDWADFRKSNVGTIRATNDADALPVDTFYQELTEMYGEAFFPSDIVNPSDQLQKIADVAKQIKVIDVTLKQNIDENFGEEARNEIVKGLVENFKTLREKMSEEVKQDDSIDTPEIKTRRWSQTVRKNDMVQTFLDKDLQDYKYVVRSNKATIAKANETLMRKGYDESIRYFDSVVESGKFPTVDDIALGERLIQETIKRGEFEKATQIVADVTILGTELGQAVQAMSMISRLSPAGQLMYLERAVKRINEKQQTKRKKPSKKKKTGLDKVMDEGKVGDVDIKITDEMKKEILSAKTPEELEIAVTRVKEQIAAQLPVEASEKLSEWRYLAMLGNPKTHIRNTAGNSMMTASYEMKNLYQRIIETAFDSKLDERTKTFKKATDVVKAFAEDMVEENRDMLTGNGYTNIQSELKNMRKIYKTKALETLKQANLKALDFEDFVFKKRTFKSTLAEYLTANGIKTEKDLQENPELIQKGINYAIEEAKKATFNQYNSVATAISRFESDKTIGKILVGGLAPFKRTPLNIVKTAWQYSPAGLAETLTLRTMDLKNGLITANDYIERISQGLTGVSITAIGFLLASMGVLTGSMGSKKKDKYEQSIGLRVPYSIKAGDRYVDISWLSPSAIPLLIGAELYSLADDGESGLSIDGIIKVLEKMMNPISEMTMLSTFNDALINYAGEDNEISGLAGIADTVIKSYIGQAFPTLGGQINRIIDPTIRTTKVSKNSKFKTGEQIARQNSNKIIGMSYLLEPSTDVWGNIQKRSDNVVLRSLDALVNPASIVKDKSTSVDKEIMRLYDENENDKIIPKTPNNYFTLNGYKYEFSAKEYTAFKITYGQTAYTELQKLFRTTEYKGMTNEGKEKAIQDVYDLAEQAAREEYGITPDALIKEYGEKEAVNRLLDSKQIPKYEMAKNNLGLSLKQYYEAYNAQKDVEGKKDAKGDTISGTKKANRINAIEKTGLTKIQATKLYKIFAGEL